MAKQSRELYITGNQLIDNYLQKIALRLDKMEGILPDIDAGLLLLESDKTLSSVSQGTMASQSSSEVTITGGTITITYSTGQILTIENAVLTIIDSDDEIIHQIGDV